MSKLIPSRKGFAKAVVALGLLLCAFLAGFLPRQRTARTLEVEAAARKVALPLVNAANVKRAQAASEIVLPANITPITEAYIYSRAAGYLRKRYVDIGDRVRRGQLLAEIDAPDLDQQVTQGEAALSQAEAQLGQAQAMQQQLVATRDLAALTWQRYSVLQATGAVSRQDGDTRATAAKTAEANLSAGGKSVRAAENNVRVAVSELERLRTLQGYLRVTAPFDGIVTSRNVDVGALISTTGSSLGPARPLTAPTDLPASGEMFRIAEIGRLRVLVPVPQSSAPAIVVGQPAKVQLVEFPNRDFSGTVTRTASSLDPASRTLLTEVQVANPKGLLLPGMYALVSLQTHRTEPPALIPDASLVAGAQGTRVAVLRRLTPDQQRQASAQGLDQTALASARRVHFQLVQPGRSYGTELEILSGLNGDEEVAVDPGDTVREGALVQSVIRSK